MRVAAVRLVLGLGGAVLDDGVGHVAEDTAPGAAPFPVPGVRLTLVASQQHVGVGLATAVGLDPGDVPQHGQFAAGGAARGGFGGDVQTAVPGWTCCSSSSRDSKVAPDGAVIVVTRAAWAEFVGFVGR